MRINIGTRYPRIPSAPLLPVLLLFIAPALAESPRDQASTLEKQGRWLEACCIYDELLSKDRNQPELRELYRRSLRHFRQQRRLEDTGLQAALAKLTASEAADVYDQIIHLVTTCYADRERVELSSLFQQGLVELRASTQKKGFLTRLAGKASEADLSAFRDSLDRWDGTKIATRASSGEWARKIIVSGSQYGIPPGIVALELACGAANSLDEYSLYLAPGRVNPAQAALKSKIVGIGVELSMVGQRLEISRVFRRSPAADAGIAKGDRIVSIDGRRVDTLAPDLASERLLGDVGSLVELEVIARGQTMPQIYKLERQAVLPGSVDHDIRGDNGNYLGYIQIHHFQESTVQEVKDALEAFRMRPLRGVIIDLRGNPGGVFKSSIGTAELFLPESVIVHTVSPIKDKDPERDLNRTYRSHNAAPFNLPLVVLVDGETASAAEVLVGALKDNQRAVVVGQPTYGKGSIQCILPLKRAPGGLRLTVAKFTTPTRVPFSGKGLHPDVLVSDPDPEAALKEAENILIRGSMMMMMLRGTS